MGERLHILELIEAGEISVEEGARRLEAVTEQVIAPEPDASTPRPALARGLWQAVFWTGIGLVAGGGLLLASAYTQEGLGAQMTWGWVLFILGVVGLALGWWIQRAHWLSVRIRQFDGPNFAFALPLPLGLLAWIGRAGALFVPRMDGREIEQLFQTMQREAQEGRCLFVEVDEGPGGEQVQVCFG
jgi:hypothetical protein